MAVAVGVFHPLLRARWRAWRRPRAVLAGAACALAWLAVAPSLAPAVERVIDAPLVPAILLFALTYLAARAYVANAEREMRTGFLAALPTTDGARRRTALLFALLVALAIRLAIDPVFRLAGHATPVAFHAASIGAIVLAFTLTRRTKRASDGRNPALHQVPKLFFARLTPSSRTFPHLPHWQRLRTTAHWRTTGRAWQLGLIALALPRNAALVVLPSLVLLGTLLWWTVMVRATTSAALDARRLLAAVAFDRRAFALTAARYPLAASLVPATIVLAAALR